MGVVYVPVITEDEETVVTEAGETVVTEGEASVSVYGYRIELRDKNGNLKQYIHPFIKGNISWTWNRIGGCGNCTLTIVKGYRDIEFLAGDDIRIYMDSDSGSNLVYRGWIAKVNPAVKSDEDIKLDIRGYFDKLKRFIVEDDGDTKKYTNMSVSAMVDDIVDTYVVAKSDITKGTIDTSEFSADILQFKTNVQEALNTLAELEGKVEYGVDEDLVFYWRAESSTIRHKFFLGDRVEVFERRLSFDKLINKIYLEGGKVNDTVFIRKAEAGDSQTEFFLSEVIIDNSSIVTSAVADRFLTAHLKANCFPKFILRLKIADTDIRFEDTIPLGAFVVGDPDHDSTAKIWGKTASGGSNLIWGKAKNSGSNEIWGEVFRDQIDTITYTASNTPGRWNIDITSGGSILETSAQIKRIELGLSSQRQKG